MKSLPVRMSEAGYQTIRIGKYHVAPEEVYQFESTIRGNGRNAVEMADNCREFIEDQSADKPFFLYFAMTSPHEPISVSDNFKGKSGIAPIADFCMETDWSAGQVIKAIDDAGISENTIVIFTADNGHSHYTGWQELIDAEHFPSGELRGHKGDIWEGGHRVPLIVRWPGKIKAASKSDQMVCLTDLFATTAELISTTLPSDGAQDSFSFLGAATDQQSDWPSRTTMINHSNFGEFAYRNKNWKLVYRMSNKNLQQSRGKPTIAELYDLSADIDESNDIADANAEVVKALTQELAKQISTGRTRPGIQSANDCEVRFDVTQSYRWVK